MFLYIFLMDIQYCVRLESEFKYVRNKLWFWEGIKWIVYSTYKNSISLKIHQNKNNIEIYKLQCLNKSLYLSCIKLSNELLSYYFKFFHKSNFTVLVYIRFDNIFEYTWHLVLLRRKFVMPEHCLRCSIP